MTEIKLHRDLYHGGSVDEALQVFATYGELVRAEEERYWVVRVTGKTPERERRLGREFANYALGLTIRGRATE